MDRSKRAACRRTDHQNKTKTANSFRPERDRGQAHAPSRQRQIPAMRNRLPVAGEPIRSKRDSINIDDTGPTCCFRAPPIPITTPIPVRSKPTAKIPWHNNVDSRGANAARTPMRSSRNCGRTHEMPTAASISATISGSTKVSTSDVELQRLTQIVRGDACDWLAFIHGPHRQFDRGDRQRFICACLLPATAILLPACRGQVNTSNLRWAKSASTFANHPDDRGPGAVWILALPTR